TTSLNVNRSRRIRMRSGISSPTSTPITATSVYSTRRNAPVYTNARKSTAEEQPPTRATSSSTVMNRATSPRPMWRDNQLPTPSAKTSTASTFRSRSLMSFSSEEVRPPAVVGAVGAGVVAHGARRGLALVGRQRTPAAVLGGTEQAEYQAAVQQVTADRSHSSSPPA